MQRPDDTRPAEVLALVGQGMTIKDTAARLGMARKTIYRWRDTLDGWREAIDHVSSLAPFTTPEVRAEIDRVVRSWMPGGMRVTGPESKSIPVLPDVLDADGEEIVTGDSAPADAVEDEPGESDEPEPEQAPPPRSKPRKPLRGQTADEWIDLAFRLAADEKQPVSVRTTALAFGGSAVVGGPLGRKVRPLPGEPDADEVRKEIGRDPGVPKAVWGEIRDNMLGPPPEDSDDASDGADVVKIDAAKRG